MKRRKKKVVKKTWKVFFFETDFCYFRASSFSACLSGFNLPSLSPEGWLSPGLSLRRGEGLPSGVSPDGRALSRPERPGSGRERAPPNSGGGKIQKKLGKLFFFYSFCFFFFVFDCLLVSFSWFLYCFSIFAWLLCVLCFFVLASFWLFFLCFC